MSGRSESSIPSPERTAAVLAVSPWPADRVRLGAGASGYVLKANPKILTDLGLNGSTQ
jgi:hypothetical protein